MDVSRCKLYLVEIHGMSPAQAMGRRGSDCLVIMTTRGMETYRPGNHISEVYCESKFPEELHIQMNDHLAAGRK